MNSENPYPTGTYVKGDQTRTADTAADAVQAVFDGFKRVQEDSDVASGFAAVNDNDPESVRTSPSETSATPDTPSGVPVDESDPNRSYSL